MLFDLKGKRRRVVQGTYLGLAILMGAGLVLFGIGSDVSGGLGDLFRGGGGGGNDQAQEATRERIEAAENRLQADPDNRAALADLVRAHYQLATADADPSTSQFSPESADDLEQSVAAWERYARAVEAPDPALARTALQAYEGLALLQEEPQDATKFWQGAANASELLAEANASSDNYVRLVQYATLAGQARKADLAGDQAVKLAPKGRKQQVKRAVEQAKQVTAQQGQGQGGQAVPAPAP